MFKTINDLPKELYNRYQELVKDLQYCSSLPNTVENLKKEFKAKFRLLSFMNGCFPDSRYYSQEELYRMKIINTFFNKIEETDVYFGESKYHDDFVALLDLLEESKNYVDL